MREINVNEKHAGQRLDKLLGKYLNEAPKSFIYKMLRKKNIKLNDKKAEGNEILVCGDNIKIFISEDSIINFISEKNHINENHECVNLQENHFKLNVVYSDSNILIANKPVGMLSQKAEKDHMSINEYIIEYAIINKIITKEDMKFFTPSVCNRLDRNTSGLILAGLSLKGSQALSKALKNRELDKYYYCIVNGKVEKKAKISGYLVKDEKTNKVSLLSKEIIGSSKIYTEYEPVKSSNEFTLLKVKLITGKTHQIRAHLASINHSIIGDSKYGNKKTNEYFKRKYALNNQLLHSGEITFKGQLGELDYLENKTFVGEKPDMFITIEKDLFL